MAVLHCGEEQRIIGFFKVGLAVAISSKRFAAAFRAISDPTLRRHGLGRAFPPFLAIATAAGPSPLFLGCGLAVRLLVGRYNNNRPGELVGILRAFGGHIWYAMGAAMS
jgi:hypothetical protein